MDYSEEIENPGQRVTPISGNTVSKQLSITTDDKNDEDLHIIGVKVKLGNSEACSFPVENPPCQKPEIFTPVVDSKRTSGRQVAESHHGVRKIKISCYDVSSGDGKQESAETGKISPILELKLGSLGKEDQGLELFIKSKPHYRDFPSENESFCSTSEYFDAEDNLNTSDKTDSGQEIYSCNNPLHKTAVKAIPKNITEVSSKQTQTEIEFETSSALTTRIEVVDSEKKQETTSQTNQKCDVSTSNENGVPIRESTEIQTESTPKRHVSFQTDTERVTGSTQTETAALFSIERTYDASNQTEEVVEATTSTDFDIYIVDRTKVLEKNTDTDDLPYAPLMVAAKEKVGSDDVSINATDSCRKECGHTLSTNAGNNDLGAANGTAPDETQFCIEKFREKLDSILKADTHDSHCECRVSETNQDDAKPIKPPFSLGLSEVDYSSLTHEENLSYHSKLEVVKDLASAFNQGEISVAVRVQSPVRFEKAAVFTVPAVIQHFLNTFCLPARSKTHRVAINPIKIMTEESKLQDCEVESDEKLHSISKPSPTEACRNQAEKLGILDVMRGKSVIVSNIPNTSAADDSMMHSQVCLCDNCYSMVQNAIQKKQQRRFQKKRRSPLRLDDNLSAKVKAKRSTTPRLSSKNFDYSVRDAWVPKKCSEEEVFSEKVEATDIIHMHDSDSDSDHSVESSQDMNLHTACEIVNDHLLNFREVDEKLVRKAAQTLHRSWFEIVASKSTDLEAVKFYIRYFEEFSNNLLRTLLHSTDSKGNNVLHFAFANNRFDLVEEFLNNGYAVELLKKTNQTGNSPLMVCSISLPTTDSDWSVARRSFETGDVNGKSSKSGQTPLMNAVSCGYEAMVDLLLEVGANPNLQDKDGSTALMYAAEHGQDQCAKKLMAQKTCDPTIRDEEGLTACSIALSSGHKNIAVIIHMQALERRQLSKHSHSIKRYVWTSNDSETEPVTVKPRSHSVHS